MEVHVFFIMYVIERSKTISYSYCVFIICLIDWREVFRSLIVFSVDVPIYIVVTTNTLEVILIPALY